MDKNKIKNDVLEELISLMESKEVDGLKSKSPKFMKAQPEISVEEELPEEEMDSMRRMKELKGDTQERHMDMAGANDGFKDPFKQSHMDSNKLQDTDEDDDLERLKEMYSRIK